MKLCQEMLQGLTCALLSTRTGLLTDSHEAPMIRRFNRMASKGLCSTPNTAAKRSPVKILLMSSLILCVFAHVMNLKTMIIALLCSLGFGSFTKTVPKPLSLVGSKALS